MHGSSIHFNLFIINTLPTSKKLFESRLSNKGCGEAILKIIKN